MRCRRYLVSPPGDAASPQAAADFARNFGKAVDAGDVAALLLKVREAEEASVAALVAAVKPAQVASVKTASGAVKTAPLTTRAVAAARRTARAS